MKYLELFDINALINRISRRNIMIIISTFVWGILCHGMIFFNIWPQHDNTHIFYGYSEAPFKIIAATAGGGRFVQGVIDVLFVPSVNTPWISGAVMLMSCGIASCFLSSFFEIRTDLCAVLLALVVVSNPIVISSNCFSGNTISFSVCICLSCCAIYCFNKHKRFIFWILLFVVINTYASYLSVILAFYLIGELVQLFFVKEYDIKKHLKSIIELFVTSVITLGFSYILNVYIAKCMSGKIQGRVEEVTAIRGRSFSEFLDFLCNKSFTCLRTIIDFYYSDLSYAPLYRVIMCVGVFVYVIMLFRWIWKNDYISKGRTLMFAILIICLPYTMNYMTIIWNSHSLMWFAFISPWIFIVVSGDWAFSVGNKESSNLNILFNAAVIICIATCVHWWTISNTAYTKLWANYHAGSALANRIVDRIENIDEYKKGETPVLFVGDIRNSYSRDPYIQDFLPLDYLIGVGAYHPTAFTYMQPFYIFINEEMCSDMNIINKESVDMGMNALLTDLRKYYPEVTMDEMDEYYDELESFPNNNCYEWVGDILVFKVGTIN